MDERHHGELQGNIGSESAATNQHPPGHAAKRITSELCIRYSDAIVHAPAAPLAVSCSLHCRAVDVVASAGHEKTASPSARRSPGNMPLLCLPSRPTTARPRLARDLDPHTEHRTTTRSSISR